MTRRSWVLVALVLAAASCSGKSKPKGRVVVAVTVDWEGAFFSPEGLDALDELRKQIGNAPITHFVSAAYFTKREPDPRAATVLAEAIHKGDELAIHLHAWKSLAEAAKVEPKLSPSFLTGTDKLLDFDDGDKGFDVDLDVYSEQELRALVHTSQQLLAQTKLPVSKSFRAGGYLGTPKVMQALRDEGFTVDSSATDYRQPDAQKFVNLPKRIREVWPKIDSTTQPFVVDPAKGPLLEMPIAATGDYVDVAALAGVLDAAYARLQTDPDRDQFVVLGFNQETAAGFAPLLGQALAKLGPHKDALTFTTIENAAELARSTAK
jgi:predicted deacetylase